MKRFWSGLNKVFFHMWLIAIGLVIIFAFLVVFFLVASGVCWIIQHPEAFQWVGWGIGALVILGLSWLIGAIMIFNR